MKLSLVSGVLVAAMCATAAADPTTIVTNAVNNYAAHHAFQGTVIVIIDHDDLWWYNFGYRGAAQTPADYLDLTSPILIASNTKTFTATDFALADHDGAAPRNTTLGTELGVPASSPVHGAKLLDLVDYWSGLPRDTPSTFTTRAALFDSLSHCATFADPCFAPESQNLYSNYGFEVLGNIVAQERGYGVWGDLVTDEVLAPLGMTKTCTFGSGCHPQWATSHAHPFAFNGTEVAEPDLNDVTDPAGGLWTTGVDMATWLEYQLGKIPSSSPALTKLNAVLPTLRQRLASGSGWSWQFSPETFSDGVSSTVRWKLGRFTGHNSYIGLADSRGVGIFVYVNRDGVNPATEDPSEEMRDDLALPILKQFP
ncbi:MAG TPA: serine hydrolase domain-containing protein [Kofleriaceae bacterium]|jgi:CubicO group peptidase (beta-lactamase class C family)